METFFLNIYRFFGTRKLWLFFLLIIIMIIAAYVASKIRLEENISKSLPGESDEVATVIEQSQLTNKLIIHLYLNDTVHEAETDLLIELADELTDSLLSVTMSPYINQSVLKVDDGLMEEITDLFYNNIPLFLEEKDYDKIDSLILPESIDRLLENDFKTLVSPASFALKKYILQDPLGFGSMALQKLQELQTEEGYEVLSGYIFANQRRSLLIFIDPVNSSSETGENTIFLRRLNDLLTALTVKSDHRVRAEYYGAAAVAVGNAEQIKKDISLTVTIAILLILVFVGWYFKSAKIPFISFLPAIFGGLAAIAVIYFLYGRMSTIALGIGSVLLGIIVDYAVYFFTLHKAKYAVEPVIKDLSLSVVICSVTSAVAFFSLLFVKSEVLRDLGLFAGLSILGAAAFALIVLPHLISKKGNRKKKTVWMNPVDRFVSYPFESNRILIWLIVVLTVVFYIFSKKFVFETNLYAINYLSPAMKAAEKHLENVNNIALKSIYVVSTGDDLDKALSVNMKIKDKLGLMKDKGMISAYTSAGSVLTSDSVQQERIRRWKTYWTKERIDALEKDLQQSGEKYGFNSSAFNRFTDFLRTDFQPLDIDMFSALRSLFLNDMITETSNASMIISIVKVADDNSRDIFEEFTDMPHCFVIDRTALATDLVKDIKYDFDLLVKLCLIFVSLMLILSFGRLETGLIASIPMFLSWIWTLGFMGITGIRFNIINIIVTTFVFGLGVDYSILMLRGLLLEYKTGKKQLTSYKSSIFLSSFTTVIGVGVLIMARHPALYSIALISVVGVVSVVIISYTIVPVFFRWLVRKKGESRVLPVTISDIFYTIVAFSVFGLGSLLLHVLILIMLFIPVSFKIKKRVVHQAMKILCKWPLYVSVLFKKRIINESGEDFRKPAMIISNHQSHIDLLLILMQYPKIIAITNHWVWNNPVYGLVIRFLDFYPVMQGYEKLAHKLRAKVDEGYSILVFPEGSRSADGSIQRFHKGAFLLAEKLGLDILPLFIHGAGDCLTKGENHLKKGAVTLRILPRIKPDDPSFGKDYHQRTKAMLKFYRKEYARMRQEFETPDYLQYKLIRNYIYKGPVLEWYVRIKLKLERNYTQINSLIPRKAKIVDIGCGYGYMTYMMAFVSEEREITGIDYDEDKIELANNCISKTKRIQFMAADIAKVELGKADVFIMSDVLHYMPYDEQEKLIERCMGQLNDKGRIIIRDADSKQDIKHKRTKYTEFFSTRSGFNKSRNKKLYFFSCDTLFQIAQKHQFKVKVNEDSKLTSNKLYVLER